MGVRGWLTDEAGRTFGAFGTHNRPRSSRRRVVPSCERLERLALLSTASPVISGVVFLDKNNNGLYQAGDAPIAGSRVELLNASGRVIGTATTDGNGAYSFSTDASRPPDPTSVSQQLSLSPTYTNINGSPLGTISEIFDPAQYTLVDVRVTTSVSTYSVLQAENTSQSIGSSITGSVSGSYQIGGLPQTIAGTLSGSTATFNASTYDGTTDYGGTSGVTFPTLTTTATNTVTFTSAADLAYFASGVTQTPTVSITAGTHIVATNGNTVYMASTKGSAVISVTYDFVTNSSLQPGHYTVVQIPSASGLVDGLASQNGVVVSNPGSPQALSVTLTNGDSVQNDFGKLLPTVATPGSSSQSSPTVTAPVQTTTPVVTVKGKGHKVTHVAHPKPVPVHHAAVVHKPVVHKAAAHKPVVHKKK